MIAPGRRGFTLIEVMVAMLVTSLVALTANRICAAALDGGARVRTAQRELDRRGNAYLLLRDAFLSLDIGAEGSDGFLGRAGELRFSAWLPVADGWNERRTVDLVGAEGRWLLRGALHARPVVLADSVADVRFDYLLEPGLDARWVQEWESPVSAPLAVRIRLGRAGGAVDTLLYLIKARG